MTALLVELRFSGLPNPARPLSVQEVDDFLRIFGALPVAALPEALCWACEPRRVYQVFLSDRADGLVVVCDGIVVRGASRGLRFAVETREDPRRELLAFLASLPTSTTMLELGAQEKSSKPKRCMQIPPPIISPCDCGGPKDFDLWASIQTLLNNTCYNFALRDLWCRGKGGYPRGAPMNGNIAEWTIALAKDGLIPARDWRTVPQGMDPSKGWHIALAIGPKGDGHFLRFDLAEDTWAHKFATMPCQTCDGAGRPIPGDEILSASLCGYCVKAFYWAQYGLTIGDSNASTSPD
jgi:hypothetical protein